MILTKQVYLTSNLCKISLTLTSLFFHCVNLSHLIPSFSRKHAFQHFQVKDVFIQLKVSQE